MLQLKNIVKAYAAGDRKQEALKGVSISFRENEFVSILGPSGSGKTTMLNIIGGLDRYTSGDLLINGISTREYTDADWDYYRNNSIGFVFQSYHLIPHQTVLANVEMALTLAGVSRKERRERAASVLEKVGLAGHIHKKPNQMSGGQMQRVAIARALVNNPDILLADEPTGALDSETSVQIMELLKEIAKDKLVIMVTHNPELAEKYSTRIIRLLDGEITADSNPYDTDDIQRSQKPGKKTSMSFGTALSLSFNNLRTKKGRTLLTAFAGSIGIIGIALILSLSAGMSTYIADVQKETMASYPITISTQTLDVSSVMGMRAEVIGERRTAAEAASAGRTGVYADYAALEASEKMAASITENNLTEFKKYLDNPDSDIRQYLGENGVLYTYDVNFSVYAYDADGNLAGSDSSADSNTGSTGLLGRLGGTAGAGSGASDFSELMAGADGSGISQLVTGSYDLLYGSWPEKENEVVLVLDQQNAIPATTLRQLGLITQKQYAAAAEKIKNGETADELSFSYADVCSQTLYLVPACDHYIKNKNGTFSRTEDIALSGKGLPDNALKLKITGVIRPRETDASFSIATAVAYTAKLTDYIIAHTNESAVIQAQEADTTVNVLTGMAFDSPEESLAGSTYENNMKTFGKISYDAPSSISIYTDSFENKDAIAACIEAYNETASEDARITYTDYVAMLTASITTIINGISYVLIAFVAISLVVSCIMIGIITHISVMERTKEIGILRALGASKRNISQVFNAETFIIGCCAGLLGIGISLLALIPINSVIKRLSGLSDLTAQLPAQSSVILIAISIVITILGGLVPARKAAKKDPVIALRTE